MNPSPENVRFHAAGHLAAACILVETGRMEAARAVLNAVHAYVSAGKVDAPPRLKALVAANAEHPDADDLRLLEGWFVHPANTELERHG